MYDSMSSRNVLEVATNWIRRGKWEVYHVCRLQFEGYLNSIYTTSFQEQQRQLKIYLFLIY